MRIAPLRLCFLTSSLAIVNLLGFAIFAPRQWKLGRYFGRSGGTFDDSVIPNASVVTYTIASVQNSLAVECLEEAVAAFGNVTVNMTAAKETYWKVSNILPPNETLNGSSRFLGDRQSITAAAVFQPDHCIPSQTVAIIIPFRDRESHLRILLGHLVPILRRQLIRYSIFVMEQIGNETFNKGRLMNTGFEFAQRTGERAGQLYDCFIFQDVDLLVEHDSLFYKCYDGDFVYHLSTTIDKFDYKPLCCGMTVGGVLAFGERQFRKVNGFPNSYWGWGGEDDDMNKRIRYKRLRLMRPSRPLGRYTMIKHGPDRGNPYNTKVNANIKFALRRLRFDGLSSLRTDITGVESYPLFTKVLVDVGKPS